MTVPLDLRVLAVVIALVAVVGLAVEEAIHARRRRREQRDRLRGRWSRP